MRWWWCFNLHQPTSFKSSWSSSSTQLLRSVQAPAPQPSAWPPLSRGRCSAPGGIFCAGPPKCSVARSVEGKRSWKGRLWGTTPSQGHPEAGRGRHEVCCPTWWCTEAACCWCVSTLWHCPGGQALRGVSLAGCPCRWSRAWRLRPEVALRGWSSDPPGALLAGAYSGPWHVLDYSCPDLMTGNGCDSGSPRLWGRNPSGGENLSCLPTLSSSHL